MALSHEFVALLHEVAAENDYKFEEYSGNAMHNKHCVSFRYEYGSPSEFFSLVIERVLENTKTFRGQETFYVLRNMMDELRDLMFDVSQDQMGKGYVFYNSKIVWEDHYEKEYVELEEAPEEE